MTIYSVVNHEPKVHLLHALCLDLEDKEMTIGMGLVFTVERKQQRLKHNIEDNYETQN